MRTVTAPVRYPAMRSATCRHALCVGDDARGPLGRDAYGGTRALASVCGVKHIQPLELSLCKWIW